MKNLYEPATVAEVRQRLAGLTPESPRQWGKMTAAQMAAHCSIAAENALGETALPRVPFPAWVLGRIIKPLALGTQPMRTNSPTAKGLIVQDDRNLEAERLRLSGLVDRFAAAGPEGCGNLPHAFFGPLAPAQWSILMYKHLDHHLRQFSV